jgi:hypothetical protein
MHARFDTTMSTERSTTQLTYAGATITQSTPPSAVSVVQISYIQNLSVPDINGWDFGAVRTYRGRLSWLATVTRPDISATVARLAQMTKRPTQLSASHVCELSQPPSSFCETPEMLALYSRSCQVPRVLCPTPMRRLVATLTTAAR